MTERTSGRAVRHTGRLVLLTALASCGPTGTGSADGPPGILRQAVQVEAPIDGIGEGNEVEAYARCTSPGEGRWISAVCSPAAAGRAACHFDVPVGSGEVKLCDVELAEVRADRSMVLREARPARLTLDGTQGKVTPPSVWDLRTLGKEVRGLELCIARDAFSVTPLPSVAVACAEGAGSCGQGTRYIFDYQDAQAVHSVTVQPGWELSLKVLAGFCTGVGRCDIAIDTEGRKRVAAKLDFMDRCPPHYDPVPGCDLASRLRGHFSFPCVDGVAKYSPPVFP